MSCLEAQQSCGRPPQLGRVLDGKHTTIDLSLIFLRLLGVRFQLVVVLFRHLGLLTAAVHLGLQQHILETEDLVLGVAAPEILLQLTDFLVALVEVCADPRCPNASVVPAKRGITVSHSRHQIVVAKPCQTGTSQRRPAFRLWSLPTPPP